MEHFQTFSESQHLFQSLCLYEPDADPVRFQEAYQLTIRGHSNANRASGEPFFEHPLHVARLLVEKRMDSDTVIAGLLHDLVEDTSTPINYIQKKFGDTVAELVNGVTKIKLSEQKMLEWLQQPSSARERRQRLAAEEQQFENFRKLLISSLNDPRVLIIKLADRLHNMTTLSAISSPQKRRRISRETIDIYVPIAMRMGIEDWKNTLAQYAFREIYPRQHQTIEKSVSLHIGNDLSLIHRIATSLKEELISSGAPNNIVVTGRIKEPYSIWLKMQEEKLHDIVDVGDIIGCRILCDNIDQCYFLLGLLHSLHRHKPNSFKDYISIPKPNGYRSLHSGIFSHGYLIEVQIRTHRMQEINDFGPAAHWRYKEGSCSPAGGHPNPSSSKSSLNPLPPNPLQTLADIISQPSSNPSQFLNDTRIAIGSEEIQVFTPKGEIINLQHKATVLDFAFAVHTDLGMSCSGARINRRTHPLTAELHNGDVVEITTTPSIVPTTNWLQFAQSPKAKSHIRRFLNHRLRENQHHAGQQILVSLARKNNIRHQELNDALPQVALKMGSPSSEHLCSLIGENKIDPNTVIHHVRVFHDLLQIPSKTSSPNVKILPCITCKPIPGDHILGMIHPQLGIIAHLPSCRLFARLPPSLPPIKQIWFPQKNKLYPATVSVSIKNLVGSLAECCHVIAQHNINVQNLNFHNNNDLFQVFSLTVNVAHRKKLHKLINAIQKLPHVNSIHRL